MILSLIQLSFLLKFLFIFIYCKANYAFIKKSRDGNLEIAILDFPDWSAENQLAKASYKNEINYTGWAFLEIETNANHSDVDQAFAAGYLEGYLTRDLIMMHWQNMLKTYCYNKTDVCAKIDDFLTQNEDYIDNMIDSHSENDQYWYQVKLYYIQLQGLTCGYNDAARGTYQLLTFRDIMWMNMLGDLDDLAHTLSIPKPSRGVLFEPISGQTLEEMLMRSDHCTGLVKLLPDHSNLYTAHVTWFSYQSMLRFHKMYSLNYRLKPNCETVIPGRKMTFTSYPALVQSLDDFYIISSGLVVGETTIGNTNRKLFQTFAGKPRSQLLTFVRQMVANRLATNGREWADIFQRHNSGTYNNQWYVVNYNKFKPSRKNCRKNRNCCKNSSCRKNSNYRQNSNCRKNRNCRKRCSNKQTCSCKKHTCRGEIEPGLLWVIEQLPGHVRAEDLTQLLVKQTYFPSYNMPYFPNMFALSGGHERVAAFGDWFGALLDTVTTQTDFPSYNMPYFPNMFALMLKIKQANVNNIRDMYELMRYNDYKHDPLSRCDGCDPPYSACNAIAARNDLNPSNGTYPFRALGHRSHGATDAKITSAHLQPRYQFLAISSPTYNISRGIPPFSWSKFDMGTKLSHMGHPDEWTFPSIVHRWQFRDQNTRKERFVIRRRKVKRR